MADYWAEQMVHLMVGKLAFDMVAAMVYQMVVVKAASSEWM